jgi:hypothetical protein
MIRPILAVLFFFACVWGIASVWGSSRPVAVRAGWTVAIALVPVVGFLAWLAFGPRAHSSAGHAR